jgi:hydrogenase/urease accessory protein HupE
MKKFYKYTQLILSFALLFLLVYGPSQSALAHEQSVAKLNISFADEKAEITWQIRMSDLTRVLRLDDDSDTNIQWREIIANSDRLEDFLRKNIQISASDDHCPISLKNLHVNDTNLRPTLILSAAINCGKSLSGIHYRFLEGLDSLHVAYLDYQPGDLSESTQQHLLNDKNRVIHFNSHQEQRFGRFVYQGLIHILIGLDHLAFLLILLLSVKHSASSKQSSSKYSSSKNSSFNLASFNTAELKHILGFVTAFTIAHSITLISASLNLIQLPSWLVETVIAGSVAWGALVVFRAKSQISTATVFGFGLIHGLGFASVLDELTGDISSNVELLLGFNIGVEIGQLAFLALATSLLYVPTKFFSALQITRTLSLPIMLLACVWMIERSWM